MALVRWCLLFSIAPALLVAQVGGDALPAAERVRQALRSGAFAEAERLSRRLVDAADVSGRPESLDLSAALDLLIQALIKNGKGGLAETLEVANRSVSVTERVAGPSAPETALAIDNLGRVNSERGEFAIAVMRHQQAIAIRQKQPVADEAGVTDSLESLAVALIRLKRLDEARQLLSRAESSRAAAAAERPAAFAHTLELIALLRRYAGEYGSASEPLRRALDIRARVSPGHPDNVPAMELLGDLEWLRGDIAAARVTWTDALALAERTLGAEHPALSTLLRRIAMTATVGGDLAEARQLLQRGNTLARGRLAPCHPEVAWLLNDLATTALYAGEYVEAGQLYRQTQTTIEQCFDSNDENVATAVLNQGDVASAMGDFADATRFYERAVRLWTATLGADHPYVAKALDAHAEALAARGANARARALYTRALGIRRRALGNAHPDVAWTLANIGRLDFRSGDVPAARRAVQQAIDIYSRSGASDEIDHLSRVLTLKARIDMARGDVSSARATAGEALETRRRVFGGNHPLTAESEADVAAADFGLGMFGQAFFSALDAERIGRDHLRFTVRYLPERQAMAYAAKRPKGLDLALSVIAAGGVADASPVFESVVQSRGVILDELAARARLTTADPASSALNASLVSARQRFANLMLRSLQGEDAVPRDMLDQARLQKEGAERAMAEVSAVARADLERARVGLKDVRGALPQGSALVSFVRYDRTVISKVGERMVIRTVPSYIAFVIRSDSPAVVAIPLGPATTVDTAVHAWRDQAARQTLADNGDAGAAEVAYRAAGTTLRRQVWDPVATHLGGATQVLIAPDGALNLVGFATLPTGARGYLVEQSRTIHYVSTERDLIPIERAASTPGLLAVGGASFDLRPAQPQSRPRPAASVLRSGCGSLKSAHFDDLPGTREEVADIARVWRRGGFDQSMILTGRGATETAVKKAVTGRQVIHLATHGFFLGSDCDVAPAGTRAVGGLTSSRSAAPEQTENPLLLSGLALAGANNHIAATSPADDGILTAEEVASLNLQKT